MDGEGKQPLHITMLFACLFALTALTGHSQPRPEGARINSPPGARAFERPQPAIEERPELNGQRAEPFSPRPRSAPPADKTDPGEGQFTSAGDPNQTEFLEQFSPKKDPGLLDSDEVFTLEDEALEKSAPPEEEADSPPSEEEEPLSAQALLNPSIAISFIPGFLLNFLPEEELEPIIQKERDDRKKTSSERKRSYREAKEKIFYQIAQNIFNKKNSARLKQTIENAANGLFWADQSGNNLLHLAVIHKGRESARFLAQFDHLINAKNSFGLTPLFLALVSGNIEAFDILIDHPLTDLSVTDRWGYNLFHAAHLAPSVSKNRKGEHQQAQRAMINKLFAAERFKKLSHLINAKNHEGDSPLLLAIRERDPRILRQFIAHGADPLAESADGNKIIHNAVFLAHPDTMKNLLEIGSVDLLNAKNSDGDTALHIAVRQMNFYPAVTAFKDIARLLISAPQIDLKITNKAGLAAEDLAQGQALQIFKAYVRKWRAFLTEQPQETGFYSPPPARAEEFWPRLEPEIPSGQSYMIQEGLSRSWQLISESAQSHYMIKDDRGNTLLHKTAALGDSLSAVDFLLKYTDIDINKPNEAGETALSIAVETLNRRPTSANAKGVLKILLSHLQIDINSAYKGMAVLEMAKSAAVRQIIQSAMKSAERKKQKSRRTNRLSRSELCLKAFK